MINLLLAYVTLESQSTKVSYSLLYVFIVDILTIFVVSSLQYPLYNLGTFGISTLPVSSVLINPMFQKALDFRARIGIHVRRMCGESSIS